MSKEKFTASEWELIKDAPFWVNAALSASDGRFGFFSKRREAKALNEAVDNYNTKNALLKDLIADDSDPSAEIKKAKKEDADQALRKIATLVQQKLGDDDLDEFGDFLLHVGREVAASSREGGLGVTTSVSDKEEAVLKQVAVALKVTDADKKGRQAAKQQQQAKEIADAKAKIEAAQKESEAKAREAEAKKAAAATAAAEKAAAEAKAKAEREAARERLEAARQEAEAKALEEKAKKEAEAKALEEKAKAEAEAKALEEQAKKEAEAKKATAAPRFKEFIAEHTVVAGDNLSFISQKYYGTQANFRLIYEANKDVIGDNMNLIRPGQVLKIPKL